MYPNRLFWEIDFYTIFLALGLLAAILLFRFLADRKKLPANLQNLCLGAGVASMFGGYFFAVLFQGVYNAIETGNLSFTKQTGATFYGGLIGGAATFLAVYFLGGKFSLQKGQAKKELFQVLNIGVCSVTVAHAFGRIGCLFAGCCHGEITTAWYGIWNAELGAKTVPTQLFESLFLFALCGLLSALAVRQKKKLNLSFYLIFYGVWRFFIEFLRADDRGKTFLPWLTPSQLTAIILVLVGIPLLVIAIKGKGEDHEAP